MKTFLNFTYWCIISCLCSCLRFLFAFPWKNNWFRSVKKNYCFIICYGQTKISFKKYQLFSKKKILSTTFISYKMRLKENPDLLSLDYKNLVLHPCKIILTYIYICTGTKISVDALNTKIGIIFQNKEHHDTKSQTEWELSGIRGNLA